MRKPAGYWTKDRIILESKNYESLRDFRKNNPGAIRSMVKNGWYSEISDSFDKLIKPKGYWTLERCREEASRFSSRLEFSQNSKTAYKTCCENDWLDDVCKHMDSLRKPSGYWTFESCLSEARKYEYKKDFMKYSKGAYIKSLRNEWIDDVCSHMKDLGNLSKRIVYSYFFEDGSVYVGITMNPQKRFTQHTSQDTESAVYLHIKKCGDYTYKVMSDGFIPSKEACQLERYLINQFSIQGYNILNRCQGGSLGGHYVTWTIEKCIEEISKFSTRGDLKKQSPVCYTTIFRNGWENLISHLPSRKRTNCWTLEDCIEVAKTCKNKKDLSNRFNGAYNRARQNGWLDLLSFKNLV